MSSKSAEMEMEDSVNVLKFAECRANEIVTLMEEVTQKEPMSKLQRLPFHMRRRAASRNPKRLPRSIREKITEKPTTKHKKKQKNHKKLLEEYNSRQKTDLWLPTHIWFAKRFHMKRMWGYQLPFQATGKRFRSSYRATMQKALLQDLSYFCCIELKGEETKLLSELSCITDDSLGPDFAAEAYIDGTREGHCFLYHPNAFPFEAIGPVSFMWRPHVPEIASETPCRQLWIWCHPSILDELVKVLVEIFKLVEIENKPSKDYTFVSHTNEMKCKLRFQKEPLYANDDGVCMHVLRDTLVRHRIIGPNALSTVASILKPVTPANDSSQVPDREAMWKFLLQPESSYYIPLRCIIGATVEDPRLHTSSKTTNSLQSGSAYGFEGSENNILNYEFCKPSTADSEIWNYDTRNEVTASQIPDAVLNKERGKYVNPEAAGLAECTTSVPVLLIHQPGVNGYASGWDIIAPQGWGMAFWIPFIYHGAQPAGLDDFCCIHFEAGCPTFPLSFPDAEAGRLYEESSREEQLKKFNRYPRGKRPNFKILGVPSPFFMPWKVLVNDWLKEFMDMYAASDPNSNLNGSTDERFFTLRSLKKTMHLQQLCKMSSKDGSKVNDGLKAMVHSLLTTEKMYLKALVLVRLKCTYRGTPTNCSGVYMPSEEDLNMLKENPRYHGPVEEQHEIEELSNMPAKKRRKILKEEARVESKKLDRPELETVIRSSERKVIGYVSEGGYSRLGSQGFGVGHCALTAILSLLDACSKHQLPAIALIREQHSFQYRPAKIEILDDIF